ncbi:DNA glycosylase [Testicularia cyperi]|uniref:DNA glycosylase n=1 Tax=Testicularia cyperi TaxID=1882483 RepID=A0A317XQK3_9BASI|nr:DNA glycosylase [Testicularia cyperi]
MASSPNKRRRVQTRLDADGDDVAAANGLPASSPSKKNRNRIRRTRDDPNSAAGSIYSHLSGITDHFGMRNDVMFCGINPGVMSATSGHHFAHRSNHFYPSLHLAGLTQERMWPEQDATFPSLTPFSFGLTNLAGRPTAEGSELMPSELIDGVPRLVAKICEWKPRAVCFVGKGISEAFVRGLRLSDAIPSVHPKHRYSVKMADDTDATSCPKLCLQIPSSVLRTWSAPAVDTSLFQREDDEKKPDSSPQLSNCAGSASPAKGRRVYSKGNSKDDSGYGIMPVCVPHSLADTDSNSVATLGADDVTFFFVCPSSSARVTTHFLDDKARVLSSLRVLVEHLQMQSQKRSAPEAIPSPASAPVKKEAQDQVPKSTTTAVHFDVVCIDQLSIRT